MASASSITGSSTAMSRPGSAVREYPMRSRSLTRSMRNSAPGLPHRAISRHNPQPLLNEVLYATRVGSGVDRVDQQAVERWPVGPPPLEFALIVAARRAHRHPDAVVGEMAQDLADRAEPVVQVEDQADRRLGLLVGFQGDLAGWPAHVAHGDGPAQLAAPRLGHPRLEHP